MSRTRFFKVGAVGAALIIACSTYVWFFGDRDVSGHIHLKLKREIPVGSYPIALAWSKSGQLLGVVSDYGNTLQVFSSDPVPVSKFRREHGGLTLTNSLLFANDDTQLLYPMGDSGEGDTALGVWDIKTGKVTSQIKGPNPGKDHAFNAGDHFSMSGDQKYMVLSPLLDGGFFIYQTSDWSIVKSLRVDSAIMSLSVSEDAKELAVGVGDGDLYLIDVEQPGSPRKVNIAHGEYLQISVAENAFSPDGAYVVAAAGLGFLSPGGPKIEQHDDPTVRIVRVADGAVVASSHAALRSVREITWDPTNRYIAAVDDRSALLVWDAKSGLSDLTKVTLPDRSSTVAISPDGKSLAVGTGFVVRIYEVN